MVKSSIPPGIAFALNRHLFEFGAHLLQLVGDLECGVEPNVPAGHVASLNLEEGFECFIDVVAWLAALNFSWNGCAKLEDSVHHRLIGGGDCLITELAVGVGESRLTPICRFQELLCFHPSSSNFVKESQSSFTQIAMEPIEGEHFAQRTKKSMGFETGFYFRGEEFGFFDAHCVDCGSPAHCGNKKG